MLAPVVAAGAFFGTATPPSGTDVSTTGGAHLKLAKMILAQGPSIAKTPVINGMPSIAEMLQARLKVNASEKKKPRSSSAPVGKQNKKNKAKRASRIKKKNAGVEEQ